MEASKHAYDCVGYMSFCNLYEQDPVYQSICANILGHNVQTQLVVENIVALHVPVYLSGISTMPNLPLASSVCPHDLQYAKIEETIWNCLHASVLGFGTFGTVFACTSKLDGQNYAMKSIPRHKIPTDICAEMNTLLHIGSHPHIVQLHAGFYDDSHLHLVMDYCPGGDLLHHLNTVIRFSERRAALVCYQLADALRYMHKCGVTHRDLKPENILVVQDDGTNVLVRVADFGLSKICLDGSMMSTVCGNVAYRAPEIILQKRYDSSVDVWSLGALMFVLLAGYHPFDLTGKASDQEILENIVRGDFDFSDPVWETVSLEAQDLIRRLLVQDPQQRITLDDFIRSSWIFNNVCSLQF